nr:MAG TPA: hypothetical protein [Caudoviricetes sp.]DAZ61235.1 MAG TPA: hypothetical protein [Caudoviricetes sp.]
MSLIKLYQLSVDLSIVSSNCCLNLLKTHKFI